MPLPIQNITKLPGGFTCTTDASKPGDFHRLTVADNGLVSCTCDGYKYRRECKRSKQLRADCESGIRELLAGVA